MLKRPIVNTLVQVFGKAVTVLISLVTTGILVRKLGPSVYGSFTLVSSVFIMFDALADFGTKIIGVREAANKEGEDRSNIFRQISWLRLVLSTIAFTLGVIFIFSWEGFSQIRSESLVSLSMIWFTSIAGSLEMIFQTKLRMDLKVIMDIAFPLLFLIALLGWNQPISLMWVFGTYLVARILSLILGFSLNKEAGIIFKFKGINWEFARRFLKMTWPMGVYLIVFSGYDRAVDSMIIQKYLGVSQVAFYGLAYKIYINLIQPAYYLVNSIFPLMSIKTADKKNLFKWSSLLMGLGILITLPVVYFLAPWIIQVLAGNGFESSVGVLRILLIALVFSYGGHLVGFTLIARGGQKEILSFGLISLIFNIGANIWAIPRYGIMGAALVTGMTEAINLGLMSWRLWKKSK